MSEKIRFSQVVVVPGKKVYFLGHPVCIKVSSASAVTRGWCLLQRLIREDENILGVGCHQSALVDTIARDDDGYSQTSQTLFLSRPQLISGHGQKQHRQTAISYWSTMLSLQSRSLFLKTTQFISSFCLRSPMLLSLICWQRLTRLTPVTSGHWGQ